MGKSNNFPLIDFDLMAVDEVELELLASGGNGHVAGPE